jgi:tight adherence protein B
MSPAFVAGLLVLVVIVLIRPRAGRGLHRLTTRAPDPTGAPHPTRAPYRSTPRPRLLAHPLIRYWPAVLFAPLVVMFLGAQFLVAGLAITAVLALIAVQRAQHKRRTAAAFRRAQIIEALDVLAADLTAGRPPVDALDGAASISPDLKIAHAAAKLGGDVPGALELAAESPGATGLHALAAAWRIADESGAAFAALTERLANSLRADEAIHRQTEASLAGARTTARLLAALPVFGITLGYSLGAKPLTFLTAAPTGWLCLTTGLTLTAAGLHWTTRLSEVAT